MNTETQIPMPEMVSIPKQDLDALLAELEYYRICASWPDKPEALSVIDMPNTRADLLKFLNGEFNQQEKQK